MAAQGGTLVLLFMFNAVHIYRYETNAYSLYKHGIHTQAMYSPESLSLLASFP